MESMQDVWEQVSQYCKNKVNEVAFDTWLKILSLTDITDGKAVLFVKTPFQRKVILGNYSDLLHEAFLYVLNFDVVIEIKTAEDSFAETSHESNKPAQDEYTFETFIVGSSNRFAHAASVAVAENESVIYNPLFIYGNSGLGKTHLLNAIQKKIKEKFPHKIVISLTTEAFTNEFIRSLNKGTIFDFHEKYRNVDVLLIDDIQFLAGKESTQEEFFNTLNTLTNNKKQIVMSSDRPPKDIATLNERIRSRFEEGLIADIQAPEYETRIGILQRKCQFFNLTLSDDIINYIVEQVKSNIRQLEGVVKKMYALSLLNDEPLTVRNASDIIRDIRNDDQPEPVTVQKIIEEISKTYNISYDDIVSKKHDSSISNARQVAMYIAREITEMPYASIGEEFGKRDHSTVVYSINQIKKRISKNSKEKAIIDDIIKNLEPSE